jgi:hypothetical protein
MDRCSALRLPADGFWRFFILSIQQEAAGSGPVIPPKFFDLKPFLLSKRDRLDLVRYADNVSQRISGVRPTDSTPKRAGQCRPSFPHEG